MSDQISIHLHRWAARAFRVLVWQSEPEPKSWLEDFDTLPEAKARADELAVPGCVKAAVYDTVGKSRYYAPRVVGQADLHRPMSVTKFAGLEAKTPSRNYSKKR